MKKFMKILPAIMVICVVFTSVFAVTVPNDWNAALGNGQQGSPTVSNTLGGIWATIVTVVRILAIAAIVFAGVRYMFASADQKADIKKSMGILAVGAILVFGATFILDLISSITNETLN